MNAQAFLVQGICREEYEGPTYWNVGIFADEAKAKAYAVELKDFLNVHRFNSERTGYWFDKDTWDRLNVTGDLPLDDYDFRRSTWAVIPLPVIDQLIPYK